MKKLLIALLFSLNFNKIKNVISNYIYNIKNKRKFIDLSLHSTVKRTVLESNIAVLGDAQILDSNIGRATYVGSGARINRTKIGRFCSIAKNIKIVSGNHPVSGFISTHPMFYLAGNKTISTMGLDCLNQDLYPEFSYTNRMKREFFVEIGNEVWIGEDVSILNGVKIGDGAVIASGAFVNKDVPPFSVYGGVPAKKIKDRFSPETINKIISSDWYNMEINDVKAMREELSRIIPSHD